MRQDGPFLIGLYMQEAGKPYKAAMGASEKLVQVVKALVDADQKEQAKRAEQIWTLILLVNLNDKQCENIERSDFEGRKGIILCFFAIAKVEEGPNGWRR